MSKQIKLSAAIATFNEEDKLGDCLESIKDLVDEIVIVDGESSDKTVEVAKSYGAKVTISKNYPIFHINKQKSFDLSEGDWILYLDADERVSKKLAEEIKKVIDMYPEEIENYQNQLKRRELFLRHQRIVDERDGKIGEDGEYVAFYLPRSNYFLGKYLKYGGVYPDGVIRLFKKGKAYLPCKDVHEQMVVKGRVGWLGNDLIHMADPTLKRYLIRNDRYINLIRDELKRDKVSKDPVQMINYFFVKPLYWFLLTLIRHKGILDGLPGIIFSFFSSLRFPRAYYRYLTNS